MSPRLRSAAIAAGEGLDRIFVAAAFRSRAVSRRLQREVVAEQLEAAAWHYGEAERTGRLFPDPPPARPRERHLGSLPGGGLWDLSWPTCWHPLHPTPARLFRRARQSRRCRVRWYRHDRPAPAVIAVHGWGGGHFGFEAMAFRVPWLYALGFDVLLHALPYHGARAPGLGLPLFPSVDPFRTNDGFGQAVAELRQLIGVVRRRGAPLVGLTGMSLGGFTTSLLATVESGLDFAVPMIPVASIPDLAWEHAAGSLLRRTAEEAGVSKARFAAAFAPTAPLARRPLVPPARVLVIAGRRDRVAPLSHAQLLHRHFGTDRVCTFAGCHLMQVGRMRAFHVLRQFLLDLVPPGYREVPARPRFDALFHGA